MLQVINHSDDITEAFLMSCSHRCQAWVEPWRGNHLTCGRKISGSLKTCISHCKQYFTTIRTLKYLRLSHRPEPLPLCCRALIYHFHYFQVYSQPVFSFFFFFFFYSESNWCVVLSGGQGLADVCRWRSQTKRGPGEDVFTGWWSDVLGCCCARWKSTQQLFAAGALASSASDDPVPLNDRRNRGNLLSCAIFQQKIVSVREKTYFICSSRGAKPGSLTPHAGPGANIGVCIEIFTDSGVRPRTEVMIQVSGDDESAWEQLRDEQVDKNTQSWTRYVRMTISLSFYL